MRKIIYFFLSDFLRIRQLTSNVKPEVSTHVLDASYGSFAPLGPLLSRSVLDSNMRPAQDSLLEYWCPAFRKASSSTCRWRQYCYSFAASIKFYRINNFKNDFLVISNVLLKIESKLNEFRKTHVKWLSCISDSKFPINKVYLIYYTNLKYILR